MGHLHAILATESPAAVLIKRGPGRRQSCIIGWDRRFDTFQIGQWVRKQLDYDCADLSPDGMYFVSYVDSRHWGKEHNVYRAVSKTPWLKALTFWSSRFWTSSPGPGMFFRDVDGLVKLWARNHESEWDHLGIKTSPDLPDVMPWKGMKSKEAGFGFHTIRQQRDGWQLVTPWEECPSSESQKVAKWKTGYTPRRVVFKKPISEGWELRQTRWCGLNEDENRGISFETFDLVSPTGGVESHPEWEWADVDVCRNRLVWTEGCILFAAGISRRPGNSESLTQRTRDAISTNQGTLLGSRNSRCRAGLGPSVRTTNMFATMLGGLSILSPRRGSESLFCFPGVPLGSLAAPPATFWLRLRRAVCSGFAGLGTEGWLRRRERLKYTE